MKGLCAKELAERAKRLRAVVAAAEAWGKAHRGGDSGEARAAKGRLLAALDAMAIAPGSARRRKAAPPRP